MKKLLIFPLSFILCLNLMVPIKAQSSYHLLFSSNTEYGPIVPQIQKAGRYYFSHDKKYNLLCGTDKKHLSILERDYNAEILSNGQNAYYIRQTPEKHEIIYFQLVKVNLKNRKKSVKWTSEPIDGLSFCTIIGSNSQKFFVYYDYADKFLAEYDATTDHFISYQKTKDTIIQSHNDYFTGIDSYPSDIGIVPIYLYDRQLHKITKLADSTLLHTQKIGRDFYFTKTKINVNRQIYHHTLMKYNLDTKKRTQYRTFTTKWSLDDSLNIIRFTKKDCVVSFETKQEKIKIKHIAYKGKDFTLK